MTLEHRERLCCWRPQRLKGKLQTNAVIWSSRYDLQVHPTRPGSLRLEARTLYIDTPELQTVIDKFQSLHHSMQVRSYEDQNQATVQVAGRLGHLSCHEARISGTRSSKVALLAAEPLSKAEAPTASRSSRAAVLRELARSRIP
jgi:hypothetical protein